MKECRAVVEATIRITFSYTVADDEDHLDPDAEAAANLLLAEIEDHTEQEIHCVKIAQWEKSEIIETWEHSTRGGIKW